MAVSLPNFGHWRVRLALLLGGRMPRTKALGYSWYDTPNIHLCTLADFVDLTRKHGAVIDRALALKNDTVAGDVRPDSWGPNIAAQGAIFLLRKN